MKEVYGDNAVGYVQLKREGKQCIVKAQITPEHKVSKKAYNVEVAIDEEDEKVLSCACKDCAASEGKSSLIAHTINKCIVFGFGFYRWM